MDLLAGNASMRDVAARLDALSHAERAALLAGSSRSEQRALFEAAVDAPPLDLDFFAPATGKRPVHHSGTNTLPLPRRLRRFEKRFSRGEDASLFGYNDWVFRRLIGPGYFVASPTTGNAAWETRGGVVIDYFRVPEESTELPAGWPRLVPNGHGLQRFVYDGTRDFMRRVSEHVSIGAAFKGERPIDHYFTLCREP